MKKNTSGSSLVAVMITVAVVTTLLGVVTSVTRYQSRNVNRTIIRTQAIAYGDAIMESLYDQWRNAMISTTDYDERVSGLSSSVLATKLTAPNAATLPPPTNITLASWSVKAGTPMLVDSIAASGRPEPEQGSNSRLRVRLYYMARVQLNYAGSGVKGATESITIERPFIRGGRNVFDYFFFGTQQETEFHPGPDMYVDGKVYIGGNLYTAHNSLHFLTDVSFMGTHTKNYRTADPRFGDAPTITTGGFGDNWSLSNPPAKGQEQKLFDTRYDQLEARFTDDPIANDTSLDSKANNDGYHELLDEKVTGQEDPLQLDASTSERLSQNADYRIFVDLNNNVTIKTFNTDGTDYTLPATDNAYVAIKAALTMDTALKDAREADNVRLVTMDISKITQAKIDNKIGDNWPKPVGDGITFYFKDTSAGTSVGTKVKNSSTGTTTNVTSSSKRGMKLINGGKLPAGGLTVATSNLMYIQGDYNTGKVGTTLPESSGTSAYSGSTEPKHVVTGYDKVPSAVAGDAVNILSNAWNDANSLTALSTRKAGNTTVNTAIIAGNVPTTTSSYSGGIENFARFHEDWTNKFYTIHGAMALLYNSQQAKGVWASADYGAPNRRWFYDTLLQDNNPPGFRVARSYERGRWTNR